MKKNGNPAPVFFIDPENTVFLSTIPIHSDFPALIADSLAAEEELEFYKR